MNFVNGDWGTSGSGGDEGWQGSRVHALAQSLAQRYAESPEVTAVALAGSQASGCADQISDVDLYVYAKTNPRIEARRQVAAGGMELELDNRYWETGDEWIDTESQMMVDVMFRQPEWIEGEIDRVLTHHLASVGYTTCLWHNVRSSHVLFDRHGWLARLRERAAQPYPQLLRQAIVRKNYPLLRHSHSSFLRQIERAITRGDVTAVQHRTAAFLASFFDLLFALNSVPHPGEKRMLHYAETLCPLIPPNLAARVKALVTGHDVALMHSARALVYDLERLLRAENLID